jgi:hypothetical protein
MKNLQQSVSVVPYLESVPYFPTSRSNPQRKVAIFWACVAIVGLALAVLPWDMMSGSGNSSDWGPPISFLSIVLLLVPGTIASIYYFRRANKLQDLLDGKELLIHWTYPETEYKAFAKQDFKRDLKEKRPGVILVLSLAVAIGIMISIMSGETGFLVIMAGIMIFLIVFLLILSLLRFRRHWLHGGETFIGRSAVYLKGAFYKWNTSSTKLHSVASGSKEGKPYIELDLRVKQYKRYGGSHYVQQEVRVPIPSGREEIAPSVIKYLETQITGKRGERKS